MITHMSPRLTLTALLLVALILLAGPGRSDPRTYLEVSPDGREDLIALMSTLEGQLDRGLPMTDPVVVILHGSEATSFTSTGYSSNRMLVDQAARLSAYRLIDVRMCETWMQENAVAPTDLPAFVKTVRYAPEEIERLEAEGYVPVGDLRI
jgi:intracellular sulfur oxidation DsrE/DsrF family protein